MQQLRSLFTLSIFIMSSSFSGAKEVWEQYLTSRQLELLQSFRSSTSDIGTSVKQLLLTDKSVEYVDQELLSKGFIKNNDVLRDEDESPLLDANQNPYPAIVYSHHDGGVVTILPLGHPQNHSTQPIALKAIYIPVNVDYRNSKSEIFKLDDKGNTQARQSVQLKSPKTKVLRQDIVEHWKKLTFIPLSAVDVSTDKPYLIGSRYLKIVRR